MTYLTTLASPLGALSLASNGEAITGLWLDGQKYFAAGLDKAAEERPDLPVFHQAAVWLDAYFEKHSLPPLPPLAPRGSEFQQRVWAPLLEIPFGTTTTYGALTKKLKAAGVPASPQAVGGAVGHNPISIFIPCHRVVGADGSLTGYAGGVEKKRFLLELEGVDFSGLYIPKKGTAL
ncbi:methylated-DNA--[protein]-cysteine S-methyltransferase [Oscillospiraceae bacterium 38-13]